MESSQQAGYSASQPVISVLSIAKNRFSGEAIGAALTQAGGFEWLGSASNCETADYLVRKNGFDVILLHTSAGSVREAIDQTHGIRGKFGKTKIVALVEAIDDEDMLSLIEAGVSAYYHVTSPLLGLVNAIRLLNEGMVFCSPWLLSRILSRIGELSVKQATTARALSAREEKTMRLISLGLSNKQIATELGISISTVKNHVHRMFHKLEATSRKEAIREGYKVGILSEPFTRTCF